MKCFVARRRSRWAEAGTGLATSKPPAPARPLQAGQLQPFNIMEEQGARRKEPPAPSLRERKARPPRLLVPFTSCAFAAVDDDTSNPEDRGDVQQQLRRACNCVPC